MEEWSGATWLVAAQIALPVLYFVYVSLWYGVFVVEQGTAVLVERMGKYHRTYKEGLHFLVPFVDVMRPVIWRETEAQGTGAYVTKQEMRTRIDLREHVLDFPLQSVVTRDNVEIQVHPMILYRLTDPMRVAYEVYDLSHAVEKLVQTTLRSIIGDMGLDDTLASREEINKMLTSKIKATFLNWGCMLTRMELLEIQPTQSVVAAMHQQLAAERIRRAAIVSAEGYRQQVKTTAEGEMTSMIAQSKGEMEVTIIRAKALADAKVIIAQAEAQAVTDIGDALKDFKIDPTDYLVGTKYMEAFSSIAKGATKRTVYFPFETDVVGAVSML